MKKPGAPSAFWQTPLNYVFLSFFLGWQLLFAVDLYSQSFGLNRETITSMNALNQNLRDTNTLLQNDLPILHDSWNKSNSLMGDYFPQFSEDWIESNRISREILSQWIMSNHLANSSLLPEWSKTNGLIDKSLTQLPEISSEVVNSLKQVTEIFSTTNIVKSAAIFASVSVSVGMMTAGICLGAWSLAKHWWLHRRPETQILP